MTDQKLVDEVQLVPNGGWDPRILVCRCAPTVDSFIVVTTRYIVFVDTMFTPATAGALIKIARPLLRCGRMPLVVNTHADWDHCWGNQLFTGPDAALPAPIIAHSAGVARYGAEMAKQWRTTLTEYPGRFDGVTPVGPTIAFTDQLTIDGGDLTLRLFLAPGHTDDHLAIEIPEIRTLLVGDAAEDPFPFASSPEGLVKLRATLHGFAALRPQVALYCHAPRCQDPSLIERNIAYFDQVEEFCRARLSVHLGGNGTGINRFFGTDWLVEQPFETNQSLESLDPMYQRGHIQHVAFMNQLLNNERAR